MLEPDYKFMRQAIECAGESKTHNPRDGAVAAKGTELIESAYRGETGSGHHAEFALLQKKGRSKDLVGDATVYTTLEPCTERSHDKLPCVDWIIKKGVRRVVIGILDPNPNICGRGYWRLLDANIHVDFFPHELATEIKKLNKIFIDWHRGGPEYNATFAWMVQHSKSPTVSPHVGLGWGDVLSLQDSPYLREGWPLSRVGLMVDAEKPFRLLSRYLVPYKEYFDQFYEEKRFKDDGDKFMLDVNPTAFSDSPSLFLRTRATRYSEVQFYSDNVATIPAERNPLIEELVRGSLSAAFPSSLCMHLVVATSDAKLLLTKRSPKVAYYPRSWSCSVEENLAKDDFSDKRKSLLQFGQRTLLEELGLQENAYHNEDLRLLSVFLEGDILNVSLCAYAHLRVDSATLNLVIKGQHRTDYEFTDWAFLGLERSELLRELLQPTRPYHPTTGYRFLMAFMKHFGAPTEAEITELSGYLRQLAVSGI